MVSIVFTGGGSAGHVTPNIALMDAAVARGWRVQYVGSAEGIERTMLKDSGISYYVVSVGKLRRYFSLENLIDPLRLLLGVWQAYALLGRLKPNLVFSKGGFVAVPVVVGAWLRRIPVISHESDVTPGLANRICSPFCRRICITFEETKAYLPPSKVILTGTPVRSEILEGDAGKGRDFLGFNDSKPILLVFGGSLGAAVINDLVERVVGALLVDFQVVHVVGRDNIYSGRDRPGYVRKEFISEEFGDVLAAASIVVSRAGANSLYEFFVIGKPHLLIPLPLAASRGDQLENAGLFKDKGFSHVLLEEDLTDDSFLDAVSALQADTPVLRQRLLEFPRQHSINLIIGEIEQNLR
jgi:UDP-N-acetylglucosamine--N-acetylmuramyl-(pentapeptide) pyrophosphoryl-undecaprenol N-acetylglucosamine transferase